MPNSDSVSPAVGRSVTSPSLGYLATVTDAKGRTLDVSGYRGRLPETYARALAGMYATFGFEDRAQGLPPMGTDAVRAWLDRLGNLDTRHVVVWDGDAPVAHAVLVPDDDAAELAIFVQPDNQGVRVGTETLGVLLEHGERVGLDAVWLHVERSNAPAISLYERYGFELVADSGAEFEMRRDAD